MECMAAFRCAYNPTIREAAVGKVVRARPQSPAASGPTASGQTWGAAAPFPLGVLCGKTGYQGLEVSALRSILFGRAIVTYNLQTLRGDLFGGITAAVVGLPVAIAFGVASGLGALAGIYGAIAVGFFATVFGGTKSQISGPTGPMAVAMAVIVTTHADTLAEAFTIVIMAGLIQILLGVMRIGRFVAFTPYSVISGFMSGIGVIIMLLQTLPFLGAAGAAGGPVGVVRALPNAISNINFSALAIAAVTLVVGVLWPQQLRRVFSSLRWRPSLPVRCSACCG